MSLIKSKNFLVGVATCLLFLSTGCLQNMANSNFSTANSFGIKQINSESDGIVALKEVFDSSVEKIPTSYQQIVLVRNKLIQRVMVLLL